MTVLEREKALCELFAEVLGIPEIESDDSFFELGGHSLLASRLVRIIQSRFGVKVSMRRVYQNPTAASLAAFLIPS
jgi:acyl carrier protein